MANSDHLSSTATTSAPLENSFMLTYLVLYGTALITLIEALRTNDAKVRHILNVETSISLIAGFVYGIFIERLKSGALKLEDVTKLRYVDWSLTTPLLLLVLLLFFNFNNSQGLQFSMYALIVVVNWVMLGAGYLAETNRITYTNGTIYGFAAYVVLLLLIWYQLLHESEYVHLKMVFFAFAVIWGLYGVAFLLETEPKNIAYNILDMISKVFFGLFMWVYYGGVFEEI
jgi:bacteriorhodopsin